MSKNGDKVDSTTERVIGDSEDEDDNDLNIILVVIYYILANLD
jgi:hypothetical protein